MFKRLWRGFVDALGCLVRRPAPDRRLICHVCAQETHNRWAFYRLIYGVRGKHVCECCGRTFMVTSTPATIRFGALALLLAGGCCSITVRTSGSGAVSVHQTRVVSTDATIPESLIP